jgi:hypothetical protein
MRLRPITTPSNASSPGGSRTVSVRGCNATVSPIAGHSQPYEILLFPCWSSGHPWGPGPHLVDEPGIHPSIKAARQNRGGVGESESTGIVRHASAHAQPVGPACDQICGSQDAVRQPGVPRPSRRYPLVSRAIERTCGGIGIGTDKLSSAGLCTTVVYPNVLQSSLATIRL